MRSVSALALSISVLALTPAALTPPVLAQEAAASEPAPEAAPPALPAINVTETAPRALTDRVIATGLITPVEEVQVQPLIEGQPIESLLADVGDSVTEGQVLAVLSKTALELQKSQALASLASARATIAQAEAQLVEAEASAADAARTAERTAKLKDQGTATQAAADTANANAVAATARVTVARQSLEAARAQMALYEAQMANVDLQLTRTEVKAPYAGRITARNATIGAIATAAGQPMFVLEKDGALEMRADLSETDVLRVSAGLTARITPVGVTAPIAGTVRLIEPAIDTTTRLGRARIAVDDPGQLRAGMFAEAQIIVAERQALAVPVTAISTAEGHTTVMRAKDGVVEQVPVTLGIRDGGWVEVADGLSQGDLVVTKAGSFVRAGDRINPITAAAAN